MKTNPTCLLLLTIALSVQGALAGRPSAPSVKMPALNSVARRPISMPSMQKMRPVAPLQRAAVPSVRMVKPTAPPVRMTRPIAPPIQLARPAVKAPVQINPILRTPALVKPIARPNFAVNPSARAKVPSFPPAIARVPSLPPAVQRPPADVKPAGNGGRINLGTGNGTTISPAAPPPTGNTAGASPIPDGLNESLAGIQEGMAIADQLKQMEDLQFGGLQTGLPEGLQDPFGGNSGNGPQGPSRPDTDFGDDMVFTPREPSNPLDHNSEPGAGLTDIRGGAADSRQGTGDGLSARGDRIYRDGVRFFGNCEPPTSTTSGGHTTRSTVCDTGGPNGPTGYAVSDGDHGHTFERSTTDDGDRSRTTTVERGPGGRVIETVTVTTNADGTRHKEITDANGTVRDMGTGPAQNPNARSCDPNPEGSSTGGPVNGTRGSLQDQLGLKPLDFLRQPKEDEQSGGGTNRMTGQIGGRQVRPANPNENPAPNTNRNRLPSNRFGNIINPGTIDTSTSGNPRD